MNETVFTLVLLLFITVICWWLVLSRNFRQKTQRSAWRLYRLNKEQQEMNDAMYFAAVLVAAIAFTTLLMCALVLAILWSV
jgi:hypothetical protein